MNYTANLPLIAVFICLTAVALKPLHAAPPQSNKAFFVGVSTPDTPVSDALDPAAWRGGVLPKETDDVVISNIYSHKGPAGLVRMKSLSSEPDASLYFASASLSVAENVTLESSIEFQIPASTLTVGGALVLDQGYLSFVNGLAKGPEGEPAPRFTGKSLKLGLNGGIRLRWFRGVPKGMPGNTVPYVRIADDVIFSPDNSVEVNFENKSAAAKLLSGEYLLLTAGGKIKGPLPKLNVLGLDPGTNTKNNLKLSPDNRQLLLVVTEVK